MTLRYALTGTKISDDTAVSGIDTGSSTPVTSSFVRSASRALRKAFTVSEKTRIARSAAILKNSR